MGSLSETSKTWIDGWETACRKIRGALTIVQEKINDPDANRELDALFSEIKKMEASGFSEMPTLIIDQGTMPSEQ
jgi:hypothetical protein